MGNNEKKAEDTLVIIDAAITESSLSGQKLNQADSFGDTTQPSPDNADVWEPIIGTIFDSKYKIEEKLGEGGMGVVYRAKHIFIDRPVAIKFLRKEFLTDTAAIERFKLEARAAARIHHPNVTTILDFGITEGNFYLVMEYLEGYSLRQQLKTNGALSLKDTLKIMVQVCDALDAAHKCNIVHKDLKPDNIFLHVKEGVEQVKVLDFGIAEILGRPAEAQEEYTSFAGTPHYMSPEQCQGDPVSPATDIYSLGIILFEMLSGQLPFNDASVVKIVLKHLSSPPPKITDIVNTLPSDFDLIIAKALSKSPEKRYQASTLLLEDLQKIEKTTNDVLSNSLESISETTIVCSNPKCGQIGKVGNKRCPRCQALSVGALLRHRYLIEKMVGKGGFGTTYLVKDLDCFDEQRILKELTLSVKDEDPNELKDMAERLFKREAQVLLNLHHSGIPRLYAYFAEDTLSYLVQDFIPGQTLSEELKKRKNPISEQEAISILSSLAEILDYLHGHNPPVVHRDIKPHNLMRHQDGRIMLIDFGAVCQAVANPQANHTVIGSLGYAPPEQFLGQTTPQSDLYAVGASVIYLLTGVPPRLLLSNSLDKLDRELEGKIKPELLSLLRDLVNPDPKRRLPNTFELKARLENINSPVINIPATAVNHVSPAPVTPISPIVASNPSMPIKLGDLVSKPIQNPPTTAPSQVPASKPSLSEAFAKLTGNMPTINTPSSQPALPNRPTFPPINSKEQQPGTPPPNPLAPKMGQQPTNNTPSLARSILTPSTNPTGQQPALGRTPPATLTKSVIQPNTNSSGQYLVQPNTANTGQKPITSSQPAIAPQATAQNTSSTSKSATPSLSQLLAISSPGTPNPLKPPTQTQEPPKQAIDFQAVAQFSYEVESMLRLIDFGNYFAILGISGDAPEQQIMNAYKELVEKFNPSKYLHLSNYNPNLQSDLRKISVRLNEAYQTLIDQNKRNAYKRTFRTGTFEKLKLPDR